jgi:phage gpG-like protein
MVQVAARFEDDTINVSGLEKFLKALKQKAPVARVGIMGSKVARKLKEGEKKTSTNAEIGAAHEFGSPSKGIPQRSFLRVPISQNLKKDMEKSGMLSEETSKEVLRTGTVTPWLETVAEIAVECSQKSFDEEGPGWPEWKDPNYMSNTGMILDDTGQLRASITKDVK